MTLRLHSEMERELVKIIQEDIEFLQTCVTYALVNPPLSSVNVHRMQDRIRKLTEVVGGYALQDVTK
ncbi:hypothetical protein LCGC14_2384350 [marine sediment metagenome]|uniref:Uncharacterized protein n=1 Tax=marine sediment metagenome TaxID=412755 RepID=A0A0F9C036_9ZZZZ